MLNLVQVAEDDPEKITGALQVVKASDDDPRMLVCVNGVYVMLTGRNAREAEVFYDAQVARQEIFAQGRKLA